MNDAIRPFHGESEVVVSITRIYVLAILCGIALFLYAVVMRNRPEHRDTANDRMAEMCVVWSGESYRERYVAGPQTREECTRYLSHRTPKDIRLDAEYISARMQDAQHRWAEYTASHEPVGPQP